jgi:hypothetical protein
MQQVYVSQRVSACLARVNVWLSITLTGTHRADRHVANDMEN